MKMKKCDCGNSLIWKNDIVHCKTCRSKMTRQANKLKKEAKEALNVSK